MWKDIWNCTQTVFGETLSAEALFQTVSSQLVGFLCPSRLKSLLSYEGKCLSCKSTWNLAAVHESEEMLSINTWCVCLHLKVLFSSLCLSSPYSGELLHPWIKKAEPKWKGAINTVCAGFSEPSVTHLKCAVVSAGDGCCSASVELFLLGFCCHNWSN